MPVTPIALEFWLGQTADLGNGLGPHGTPYDGPAAPAVSLWAPVGPGWFTPQGAVSSLGGGWWSVAPVDADQQGGDPLLLFATAPGCDPAWAWYLPDGQYWTTGTSTPFPLWLGTAASQGFLPAAGLISSGILSILASYGGAPLAQAAGTVAEPGGAGQGRGFYLYAASPAEVAAPGDILLLASATLQGVAQSVDAPYAYRVYSPTPTPTPPPPPPPAAALMVTDPDLATLITPGAPPPAPGAGPQRLAVIVGSALSLPTQCRQRGTGSPSTFAAADTLAGRVYPRPAVASVTASATTPAFTLSAAPGWYDTGSGAAAAAADGQALPVLHTADTRQLQDSNSYTLEIERVNSSGPGFQQDTEVIARYILDARGVAS